MDNKKSPARKALISFFISLELYLSGILSQLLRNYALWQQSGDMFRTGPSPPSFSLWQCIKALFRFPYGLFAILLCFCATAVLAFFLYKRFNTGSGELDQERNFIISDKGTYGTAGYMTKTEMQKLFEVVPNTKDTDGTILGEYKGKIISMPKDTFMNRNIAVIGASGTMKSRAFARNMILQCVSRGESLYITDPKSELFESMAGYLSDCGYMVRCFNIVNPEHSDGWDILKETEGQELFANLFCDVIIKNTISKNEGDFWDKAELTLLKALVLYVSIEYPEETNNFDEVYKLICFSTDATLRALFTPLPITHPARAPYELYMKSSDTVRAQIISGLGIRLQVFQNELIKRITTNNDIDITLPGKERCAFFCITSDQDSTFDFLSSLFLSFVFIKLVRYADKHGEGGRLPVPVHILADEIANIGVINDLPKKLSTIRSRALSLSLCIQGIGQLRNRYPNDQWAEVLGNCDTTLFLGCNDALTASYIAARAGEMTVEVSSENKTLNTIRFTDYTPEYREVKSTGRRKLLTEDEVLRLPIHEALVIIRGQKVLKVNKYDYTKHHEAHKLRPQKVKDYVPKWRRELESQAEDKIENDNTIQPSEAPEKTDAAEGFYIDNDKAEDGDARTQTEAQEKAKEKASGKVRKEEKVLVIDKETFMSM